MKKILAFVLMLALTFSCGAAEVNLADMSLEELAALRDQITQEINDRAFPQSAVTIDGDTFTMEITLFEEGGKQEVDDYYTLFNLGKYNTADLRSLIFFFNITNKGEEFIYNVYLYSVSINGWMTSGNTGVQQIAAQKKAKGFGYLPLLNCDAASIDDIQSVEFEIVLSGYGGKRIETLTVQFVRSGNSFVLVQ